MEKEVKFSLVFRDMWQSAGKYVPRVDQLVKVAVKASPRIALADGQRSLGYYSSDNFGQSGLGPLRMPC